VGGVAPPLPRRRAVLDPAAGEPVRPADRVVDRLRRSPAARGPRPPVPAPSSPRSNAGSAYGTPDLQRSRAGGRGRRAARGLDARPARVSPRAPACLGRPGRAPSAPDARRLPDRRQTDRPGQLGSRAGRYRLHFLMGAPARVIRLALLLGALALWPLASSFERPEFVQSPLEIAGHFVEALRSGELLPHVGASLVRSIPGFLIGSLIGVILGLLAGVARSLDQLLSPVVFLTYPVPKILFLPIVILW